MSVYIRLPHRRHVIHFLSGSVFLMLIVSAPFGGGGWRACRVGCVAAAMENRKSPDEACGARRRRVAAVLRRGACLFNCILHCACPVRPPNKACVVLNARNLVLFQQNRREWCRPRPGGKSNVVSAGCAGGYAPGLQKELQLLTILAEGRGARRGHIGVACRPGAFSPGASCGASRSAAPCRPIWRGCRAFVRRWWWGPPIRP